MKIESTRFLLPLVAYGFSIIGIGCGTSPSAAGPTPSPTPTPIPGSSGARSVFAVANTTPAGVSSVLEFPAATGGEVRPKTVLTGPPGVLFIGVATDSAGNLYVGALANADRPALEIFVYAPGSSGSATPIRTIGGSPTSNVGPQAIIVDGAGQIYGAGPSEITVFAPGSNGDVAPSRVIQGPSTMLLVPTALALDSGGNLYVAEEKAGGSCEIDVFSPSANGDVAPIRRIAGPSTHLTGVCNGVAVDSAGTIYAGTYDSLGSSILEFSPEATGDVAPSKMISGPSTGFRTVNGMSVDTAGTLYAQVLETSGRPAVDAFKAGASGDVAPTTTITSPGWMMSFFGQIALK